MDVYAGALRPGAALLATTLVLLGGWALPAPAGSPAKAGERAGPGLSDLRHTMGLDGVGPLPYHVSLSAHPSGTTYEVSNRGSDTAPCTASQPCRQVSEALALVVAGDTITVSNGTFLGFDVGSLAGTAGSPIKITSPGRGSVLVNTVNRSDNRDIVHFLTSSHIVMDGFRAFNANRAAVRIDQSNNITVTNGTFGNDTTWGIFTDFDKYSVIEHDTCYGSVQQHGIYVSNSPVAPTLRWNKVYKNYGAGIQINADATQGGWGISSGGDVEDNVLYDNGAGGGAALNFDGVWNTRVVNNLLYENHATGIVNYYLDGLTGPHGMTIMDNTVVMASDGRWALQFLSTTGEDYVRNNVLDNLNPAHGGEEFGTWGDVSNTSKDYEIQDTITVDSTGNIYTLAQWQGMGYEPHSLSASPASLFVNPSGGDYHLMPTSPAIKAGQALANVSLDLDGKTRPTTSAQDIGCYQYAPAGPTPLGASLTAAPTSGTVPLTVAFTGIASGGRSPYSFSWSFGDGSPPSRSTSPSHTYNTTGTFAVVLTVTDSNASTAHAYTNLTVNAPPPLTVSASASPLTGPAPLNATFSSTPSGGAPPYTYFWAFGDGSAASHARGPLHEYNASGSFTSTLRVNDSAARSAWANVSVTVTASGCSLAVTAAGNPNHGTAPLLVSFTSLATCGRPPYSYAWDFGDGSSSTTPNPGHTYATAGSYSAVLTVTDATASSVQSLPIGITVAAPPPPLTVKVGGATSGTAGASPPLGFWAAVDGGSGSFSYAWNFGDAGGWSSSGSSNRTTHVYQSPGTFQVEVFANDSAGQSARSSPFLVAVGSPPSTASPSSCASPCLPSFLSPLYLGLIALVAALLVVGVLVARKRRLRPPDEGQPLGAAEVPVAHDQPPGTEPPSA